MRRKVSGDYAQLSDYLPKEKITLSKKERRQNALIVTSAAAAVLILGTAVTLRYTLFANLYGQKFERPSRIAAVSNASLTEDVKEPDTALSNAPVNSKAARYFSDAPAGVPTPEASPGADASPAANGSLKPSPSPSPTPEGYYSSPYGEVSGLDLRLPSVKLDLRIPGSQMPTAVPFKAERPEPATMSSPGAKTASAGAAGSGNTATTASTDNSSKPTSLFSSGGAEAAAPPPTGIPTLPGNNLPPSSLPKP